MAPITSVGRVFQRDIYHGLPQQTATDQTAIITGANGISGYHMLEVLFNSPQRWTKIYCLSRRPPLIGMGKDERVEHIPVDFLSSPEEIATVLREKNVTANYIFFFSYIQPPPKSDAGIWSDADELTRVNTLLLENFLLALTSAGIKPDRFMLQTGAKNYASHLGPTKLPQEESDPRVECEKNFYYYQEDVLFRWCAEQDVGWNICMPSYILGAVPDAAMNLAYGLAIYAALSRELRVPLEFPGDLHAWQKPQYFSTAMLNAYMEEWAVLTARAKNQKFNTIDNCALTWETLWPKIADYYGMSEWRGPDLEAEYVEVEAPFIPRRYGPPAVSRTRFSTMAWFQQANVQAAWARLREKYRLVEISSPQKVFGFLDGALFYAVPQFMSMDKSRKLGWHGFVDSSEFMLKVLDELGQLKMIPPSSVHEARLERWRSQASMKFEGPPKSG